MLNGIVFWQHLHSFGREFTFQVTRHSCDARHGSCCTVSTIFLHADLINSCFVPIHCPAIHSMGAIRSLLFIVFHSFIMYSYGFLNWGFTDWREILHGGSATSRTGLLRFLRGVAPTMAELLASTGAIWRDMFLAEALVCYSMCCYSSVNAVCVTWCC